MRKFARGVAMALCATLAPASRLAAQEFNVPAFYMSFPPTISIPGAPAGGTVAPTLTNVVHVFTAEFYADPALVANHAATDILDRLYPTVGAPTLLADKICLNMIWLGHNIEGEYNGDCVWQDHRYLANRFFREADRLHSLDDQGVIQPGGTHEPFWPIPRPQQTPCPRPPNWPADADFTAARAYRHPFLSNARTGSVLRNWCEGFVARYKQLQDQRLTSHPAQPLPDPDMFLVDDETWITLTQGHASRNAMFMLWFLATHNDENGNPYWTNPQQDPRWYVPGYSPQRTLAELYAEARARYPSLPVTVQAAIQPPGNVLAASDPPLRALSAWWSSVNARAIDATWEYSLYSVVRAAWPATNATGERKVKCSNYGVARWDGALDSTSFFRDRDCDLFCNPPLRHTANTYPRGFIEPAAGQYMYRVAADALGNPANPMRWLTSAGWCSADVDSPYLYWLRFPQFDPAPCGGGWQTETWCNYFCGTPPDEQWCSQDEGHKQLNMYLPGNPPETQREATQRHNRHAIESCLNSDFAGLNPGPLLRHRRPWPWIEPAWNPTGGNPYGYGAITPEDFRILLADRRASNIRGFTVWPDDSNLPIPQLYLQDVMDHTARVVYEVYAPRIFTFQVLRGIDVTPSTPCGSPPLPPCPAPSDADDATRLEFTLRGADNQPRTVNVQLDPSMQVSEVLVSFQGMEWYLTNPCAPSSCSPCVPCGGVHQPPCRQSPINTYYDYLIRVEDSTSSDGVYGFVMAWDYNAAAWAKVPTEDGQSTTYEYFTPDRTSRRTFVLAADTCQQFVSNDGWMLLKLVQVSTVSYATLPVAKYDLVQVLPYPWRFQGGGGLTSALASDVDYNGAVNAGDLSRFVQDWFTQSAVADANMDGQVDEADLTKFLTAYALGG